METVNADLTGLTVAVDLDRIIEQMRHLIAGGTLPETVSTVALRKDEVAYMRVNANWSEMVRESDGRDFVDRLRHLADGTLQVTNQRLIFTGAAKHAAIGFADLIDVAIVGRDLRLEVVGPHDPYFSIEPIGALEITELVIRKVKESAEMNKRARLVGVSRRTRRKKSS